MKKTYKNIYPWNVINDLDDGHTVYCLDRDINEVFDVASMSVRDAFQLIKVAVDEETRFQFWMEVKEETDNG